MDDFSRKDNIAFHHNLVRLREDDKFTDFTICIGDWEFRAHKVVLAASSDYFKAMLSHNSKESAENKVELNDISVTAMESILNFCYKREVDLDNDNVQDLLIAASILQISTVKDLCINFIKERVDTSNCLGILTTAERYNLPSLLELSLTYCIDRFPCIVKERQFLELEYNMLLKIISHDELNVMNEIQVFQAISDWIKFDPENRTEYFETFVEQVRFAFIEPINLVTLTSNELVKNSTKCGDIINRAKDYLLLKDHPQMPQMFDAIIPQTKPRNTFGQRQRLFAVGGWTDEFKSIASAEMYDPNVEQWIELKPMDQKRCGVGLTTLGNSIYAVGGHDGTNHLNTIERYDIPQGAWFKDVANMKHVRTSVGVISLDDKIYAIGGEIGAGATNQVEKYDRASNSWTSCALMNRSRLGAGVAILNGLIYVMGGERSYQIHDSVERYDPVKDTWTNVAPMTISRKLLGCTTCNGLIYAIGGRGHKGDLDSAECYNPKTDTWTEIKPMHMKRSGIGVVELGGSIYVVGGQNQHTRLNVVEAYDPETEQWDWKKPMIHARLGGGMTVYSRGHLNI